ncbi:MAG: ABC transporter permease [Anaerolineales bacterium]
MEAARSPIHRLTANIRLFYEGAYLSYVALFTWFAPWTYLASKVIMPLGQILFFTYLGTYATGPASADFYVIGNAVQLAAISGVYGVTMSIGGDRWSGTLPYLFGAPANRLTIFVGRAAIHVVDGMIGVAFGLAWGALLLGLDLSRTDPLALTLTIVVTAFSTSGLGLMLGSLSLITVNVMFVNNLIYFMLLIFSGSNLDLTKLPAIMQAVSQGIPLTRGIASARLIIAGGSLAEVTPLLMQEVGIGLIYALVGYAMFRWFEIQAKRRGTLEVV